MKTSDLRWEYHHHKDMLIENRTKGNFTKTHMDRHVLFQIVGAGKKFQGEVTHSPYGTSYQLTDGVQRQTEMTVERTKDFVFRKALEGA